MSKNKQNTQPVNPMKPAPEAQGGESENEETLVFETEDVAAYAAEAAEEYGLDLAGIEGTGEDGIITADDVDKAVEYANSLDEDNNPPTEKNEEDQDEGATDEDTTESEEETVNFASEPAGEFYAENEDKINLDDIKGTGKDGAITKGDLVKALEEQNPAEDESEESEEGESKLTIQVDVKDADKVKEILAEAEAIVTELVSFGLPVKGTLRNKPKVLERWNELNQRAIKFIQNN